MTIDASMLHRIQAGAPLPEPGVDALHSLAEHFEAEGIENAHFTAASTLDWVSANAGVHPDWFEPTC